jgi:hypothetical protein
MEAAIHTLRAIPIKLLLVVTAISLIVGQFHPFSRFPMYSSFPPTAELYYLADETGKPLPSLKTLGIFGPELKQRVEHQCEAYGAQTSQPEQLNRAGNAVLGHLANKREANLKEQGINGLSIRRVLLHRENGELIKKDEEVAAWP